MAVTDRLSGAEASRAVKAPCYVASTGNLTLSSSQTIDGVLAFSGARVLVKDQTDATENGIYLVDSSTWTRAKDFDKARDIMPGTLCYVDRGTAYGGSYWVTNSSSTSTSISIGTASISFTQVNALLAGGSTFGSSWVTLSSPATARDYLGLGGLATTSVVASSDVAAAAVSSSLLATAAVASSHLNLTGSSTGAILYHSTLGAWRGLAIGASGMVLTSSAGLPVWSTAGGGGVVATQAEMEARGSTSALSAPAVMKYDPGVLKAGGRISNNNGTVALISDFGVASVADTAIGRMTVTTDDSFASTSVMYPVAIIQFNNKQVGRTDTFPASSNTFEIREYDVDSSLADPPAGCFYSFLVAGDLA